MYHFTALVTCLAILVYFFSSTQVSRARITQIMNLLVLAPDIQEALLFLPSVEQGFDPIHLRQLQPLARALHWRQQRRLWRTLLRQAHPGGS